MNTKTEETIGQSKPGHQLLESGFWGVLFLGIFLYIWKGIEPHLLYYGYGVFTAYPIFSLDSSFLQTTLNTPGEIINALGALLAQTYQTAWLGALIITATLGILFLGIRRFLASARVGKFGDLAWFPVLLALPIYSYYYEDPLPSLLAVGLSVWTAVLYRAVPMRTSLWQVVLFGVFFFTVYYLAGASAFIFAAMVYLTEALLRRKIVLVLIQAVLAAGGVLILGGLIFDLDFQAVYTVGTPWDPSQTFAFSPLANWLALVLHVWVPLVIGVAILSQILLELDAQRIAQSARQKKRSKPAAKPKRTRRRVDDPRVLIGLRMLLVIVVTVPSLRVARTYKHDERALHYFSQQRDWDQVVTLTDRIRSTNSLTRCGVFDINRALAHQGRLGSRFCAYPQEGTGMLFMNFDGMSKRLLHAKSLDLYMDLGYLNLAEKNAYELIDLMGPSPYVFEALIRIHLAKGQYESARVLFRALQKFVGCRPYVHRWQTIMDEPVRANDDPLIQSYRKVRPIRDDTSMVVSLPMLERLLQDVPSHRLAFEYLMAGYLLRHEHEEFMNHLPLLKSLGYQQLPRHYAEALLVHSLATGTPLNTQGWTIDPDLQRQFHEIRTVVTRTGGVNQTAFDALAPKYGDTYMFYTMFDLCGIY